MRVRLYSQVARKLSVVLVPAFSLLWTACSGLSKRPENPAPENPKSSEISLVGQESQGKVDIQEIEHEQEQLDEILNRLSLTVEAEERDRSQREKKLARSTVSVEMNERVKRWIEYFTLKDKERFQRFLNRGTSYRSMIESVLEEHHLPKELYFLAMIESGFVTAATSRSSAVGVWQFIRATGHRYGLKTSRYLDERRDPIRATQAAARYLTDLHNVFHSWYLAIAAYNAGERRILNAILRGKSRDFWELAEKKVLPSETMNYVPKFLAAIIIGRNPKKFGFREPAGELIPQVEMVTVPSRVRLRDIAREASVSYSALKTVNPHLISKITPTRINRRLIQHYPIWVPKEDAERVRSQQLQLAKHRAKVRPDRSPSASNSRWVYHRVRRGENLSTIADRHGTTAYRIKRTNGLRSSRILVGQRLRIPTSHRGGVKVAKVKGPSRNYNSNRILTYRVQKGDNLYRIARKFGISVARLKRINGLRSSRIFRGQFLTVRNQAL